MNRSFLTTSLALLLSASSAHGQVFVSQVNGDDINNDGRSWTSPYKSLQRGIDEVAAFYPDGTLLVAQGKYGPGGLDGNPATIVLKDRVNIFGGFLGRPNSPITPYDPDGNYRKSQIIGTGSARCVETESGVPVTEAKLRGFLIRDGNATSGGGVYCNNVSDLRLELLWIENCNATGNGGGIYVGAPYTSLLGATDSRLRSIPWSARRRCAG